MYGDELSTWISCVECGRPAVNGWSNPDFLCDKCRSKKDKEKKNVNGK